MINTSIGYKNCGRVLVPLGPMHPALFTLPRCWCPGHSLINILNALNSVSDLLLNEFNLQQGLFKSSTDQLECELEKEWKGWRLIGEVSEGGAKNREESLGNNDSANGLKSKGKFLNLCASVFYGVMIIAPRVAVKVKWVNISKAL